MNVDYKPASFTCSNCGNHFDVRSAAKGPVKVDICSQCHPAYTGKVRQNVSSNQVDKFRQRFDQTANKLKD